MTTTANVIMVIGGLIAVLGGIGILRFSTPYARFHAAGKASPIAFLVAAIGAGIRLGFPAAAVLIVVGAAMVLTLPVGVHLLFRAVHYTTDNSHLVTDELAAAQAAAATDHQEPHP